jgi:hypothetical protein
MPDSADTALPDLEVISSPQAENSVNRKRTVEYAVRTFAEQ